MNGLNKLISSLCTLLGAGAPVVLTTQLLTSSLKENEQQQISSDIEEISVNFYEEEIEPSKFTQQKPTKSFNAQSKNIESSVRNSSSAGVSDSQSSFKSEENIAQEIGSLEDSKVEEKDSGSPEQEKSEESQTSQESSLVSIEFENNSENQDTKIQSTANEEESIKTPSISPVEIKEEKESEPDQNIPKENNLEQTSKSSESKSSEDKQTENSQIPTANRTLKKDAEEQLKVFLEKLLQLSN